MAALTSIAVTNRLPKSCTITFNAASIDLNSLQLRELATVVNKLLVECSCEMSSDTGVVATGI